MQVPQVQNNLCTISISPSTGEVWNIHTGQVIGIVQSDGLMFIPYSGRYAYLADRRFDSFEDFHFYYDQIVHDWCR